MLPERSIAPRTLAGEQIVGAILDASAILLEQRGIDGLTTNAVARLAGVSIGSVYKYFPNKQAIVLQLAQRIEARALEAMLARSGELASAPVREITSELIDLFVGPALGGAHFRRALLVEVPRAWTKHAAEATDDGLNRVFEAILSARPSEVRAGPHARMAFVVQHALEGVVEAALLHDPGLLASAAFAGELNHLAWRYLAARWAPPDEARRKPRAKVSVERAPDPPGRSSALPAPAPVNARGRAGVDRIVEASARVLCRLGYVGLSIRSIAREAHIAPSAVYRHFPTKEAVVAELARRHEARILEGLLDRMGRASVHSGQETAHLVAQLVASPELGDVNLRRAIREQVPPIWIQRALGAKHDAMRAIAQAALEARQAEMRRTDLALASFVLVHAFDGVVQAAVRRRQQWVAEGALIEELAFLAWEYVRRCEP